MAKELREVVAVFHDEISLQAAVDELLRNGFDRACCSLLADRRTVEKELGRYFEHVADIEDNLRVPRSHYFGPVSRAEGMGAVAGGLVYVGAVASIAVITASGGTAAAVLLGAVLVGGAGGIVGTALSRIIGMRHGNYLKDQLDRGGLILWVRAENPSFEKKACEILHRHSAEDVHGHDLPAVETSREGGVSHALSFMNLFGL